MVQDLVVTREIPPQFAPGTLQSANNERWWHFRAALLELHSGQNSSKTLVAEGFIARWLELALCRNRCQTYLLTQRELTITGGSVQKLA